MVGSLGERIKPYGVSQVMQSNSAGLRTVIFVLSLAGTMESAVVGGLRAQHVDATSLAPGQHIVMYTLLEKTIFKVDVLTLEVRFGEPAAQRLAALARNRQLTKGLADSIASAALEADDVLAHIRFERNVSLEQFVNAVRNNAAAARDAGIISEIEFAEIARGLPVWYRFLADTGIKDGDEMLYRIRGDTLRTVYRTADGDVKLDQTDVGASRRLSVMGGYFAPKSDFRKGLIASLFRRIDS